MSPKRLSLVAGLLALAPAAAGAAPPADGWVIWQSIREDARNEIYRARADGSEVTRLTRTGATRPMWSHDGRWIAYSDDVLGVFVMRPDGTEIRKVSSMGWPAFWLHDNAGLVISEGEPYLIVDPDTGDKTVLFTVSDFPQLAGSSFLPNSMTHDNRYLLLGSNLYISGFTGANGSFKSDFAAMLIDLAHKDRVYYLGSGCWPFTPPEGNLVFHICGDGCDTHPDVYRMSVADLASRVSYQAEIAHSDPDWGHEYNPRVSTDNKWIVYMTSTGCHDGFGCDYEIFLHQLGAGATERTRVTESPTFDGYPDMFVGPLWTRDTEPQLRLSPSRLTIYASTSEPPPPVTVRIKSATGTIPGAIHASVAPPAAWLSVDTATDSITVRVRGENGLVRGSHPVTVTVTVDGAQAAPMSLPLSVIADDSFTASAPDAAPPATSDASTAVPESGTTGCSCSLAAPTSRGPALWLLAALAATRLRRRRTSR